MVFGIERFKRDGSWKDEIEEGRRGRKGSQLKQDIKATMNKRCEVSRRTKQEVQAEQSYQWRNKEAAGALTSGRVCVSMHEPFVRRPVYNRQRTICVKSYVVV